MKAKLGGVYVDRLHQIKGIAVARTEYITGCARVSLDYVVEGGEIKTIGVDEPLLALFGDGPDLGEEGADHFTPEKKGGPRPAVPRAVAP